MEGDSSWRGQLDITGLRFHPCGFSFIPELTYWVVFLSGKLVNSLCEVQGQGNVRL